MAMNVKYSFVIRTDDSKVLVKGTLDKTDKYTTEANKITTKLVISSLKPGERKKIESPNHGNWLSLCGSEELIFAVCVAKDYSERLANQFLDVILHDFSKQS
jgi:hypothetical protein